MAGDTVGQARITLVPDLSGFHKKASRELRTMDDLEANVQLVPDMRDFRRRVKTESEGLSAKVKVDADTTGVRKKVEAETKGMDAKVDVDADVSGFRRRIGLLKAEVKGVGVSFREGLHQGYTEALADKRPLALFAKDLSGVGTAFKNGLRQGYTEALEDKRPLARAAQRINTTFSRMKPTINVDADTAAAEAKIATVARPRKATINVDADTGGAMAKIATAGAAGKAAGSVGGGGGGGLASMGLMVGALIVAVPILTGLIGGLLFGIGGLAVAAVPALAAVAIGFEGIKTAAQNAAPAFNELKTVMTDTLASSMAEGFTQVGAIIQGLIPQAQAVGEAFGGMFTSLMTAISTQAMPQLQTMMSGFATFLTAMTPGLTTLTLGFLDLGASFGANAQLIGTAMGNLLAPMGSVLTTLSQTGVLDIVMQNFAGTLTSLGTVLGGLMEGLAYAANGVLPNLNQAFTALGGILPTIGIAMGQVGGLFSGLLTAIMPILGVVFEALGSVAAALMPALQPLIGFGAALAGALAPVGQVLGSLAGLIGQVFAAIAPVLGGLLTAFTPVLQALADGFGQIFMAVSPLIDALGGALMQVVTALTPIIAGLAPIFTQLAGILSQVVGQVVAAIVPIIQQLVPVITQMAPILGEIAGTIGQALISVVGALAPVLPILAQAFGQILMAIAPLLPALGEIVLAILPVLVAIVNALTPLIPPIADLLVAIVGALTPIIGLLANLIAAVLPPIVSFLAGILIPVINFLAGILKGVLTVAVNIVVGVLRGLGTAFSWIGGVVSGVFRASVDFAVGAFNTLKSGMGTLIRTIMDYGSRVWNFFTDLRSKILGAFAGAASWLFDAGKNIVQGLINGVKSLAGTIGEAFLSVVPGWIKGPFKKAMGIHSPSRVMAEYGVNIGEGLLGGMDTMTPAIQAKSETLASAADPATNPGGSPGVVPVAPATVPSVAPAAGNAPADPTDAAGLAATTAAALQGVALPAWEAFGAAVRSVQSSAISPAAGAAAGSVSTMATGMGSSFASVNSSLWNTGATFSSTVNGTITPSWAAAGNNIRATQAGPIETAFRETRNSLNATAATFGPAANNIAVQWSQVREGTARPVRFVISSVFNDGVVGMWNSVSDLIGTSKMGAYPVRFATGGILPGYTPGRDPHVFTSPTGGTLALSGGEAIMRPEWTKAVGSDYIRNANAAAAKGKLGNPKSTYQGASDHQAFARGGIVDSMAWVMRNKFPMLQMTSGLRYTDNGYHSKGMAADFSNGYDSTPAMRAAAAWIFGNYRRQTIQLIHSPSPFNIGGGAPAGNGMGYYGGGTMSEHRNHVHWAVNSPVTLEGAGPVPEGFTAAGGDAMSMADMVASFTKPFKDKITAAVSSYRKSGGNIDSYVPKMADKLSSSTEAKITKKMEEMSSFADPGGAGVQRWAPMVSLLLKRYGQSEGLVPTVLRRMNQESGGNPRAINNWDSNAAAGTPSKGLMQVIDPTFASHRDPTLKNDIWDPMANVGASMRYAMSRYGSLASAYNRAGGYDAGGWLGTGVSTIYNGFTKPEAILTPAESERFVNVADMFIQDANAGGKYVGQYIENQHVLDVDEVEAKTRRGIRRAMKEEGVSV